MSWLPSRQVVFGEFSHCLTWLAVSAASVTPVWKSSKKSPIKRRRSWGSRSMIWFARRSLSWISGRISQRIPSVLAVPLSCTMTPAIASLPYTLEVFYRHAGPGASVVRTLARLREDYFDAVGPERRLTPFGPIRIRTVICKGNGFFDCIGFNVPGQFSSFVRDDLKCHFRLFSISITSLSNDFHNPATPTSLSHDRCGAS